MGGTKQGIDSIGREHRLGEGWKRGWNRTQRKGIMTKGRMEGSKGINYTVRRKDEVLGEMERGWKSRKD